MLKGLLPRFLLPCLLWLGLLSAPQLIAEGEKQPLRSQWQLENAERKTVIERPPAPALNPDHHYQDRQVRAHVVPIKGGIGAPQLFILRRALKQAIEEEVDVVVIEMDTLGGDMMTMLEMMEALDRFEGETITWINDEAISAGAFIAIATDYIYFSPKASMGAGEMVQSTGEDVPGAAKRKATSYVDAKVRILSAKHRYRADVMRAMFKPEYELIIDEETIVKEGELLTLIAEEAVKAYGAPPQSLLSSGTMENVSEVLEKTYGKHSHEVKDFDLSWSEELAKWLNAIAPILMGIGMLAIFIEFKTPGFGLFGGLGIAILLVVFFGHHVAGLAGYEAILIFLAGIFLLSLELFVLPGTLLFGALGIVCLLGSLLWSAADLWPGDGFNWAPETFRQPIYDLALALVIAVGGFIAAIKLLPENVLLNRLILRGNVNDGAMAEQIANLPQPGTLGLATTRLYPSGEVEIDGKRYLARSNLGMIEKGRTVRVIEATHLQLSVEEYEGDEPA